MKISQFTTVEMRADPSGDVQVSLSISADTETSGVAGTRAAIELIRNELARVSGLLNDIEKNLGDDL